MESKTIFVDSGRGAFQTSLSISASIDGTTIPVSGATVGALKACKIIFEKKINTFHKHYSNKKANKPNNRNRRPHNHSHHFHFLVQRFQFYIPLFLRLM